MSFRLKPQRGLSGLPFMNTITRCDFTKRANRWLIDSSDGDGDGDGDGNGTAMAKLILFVMVMVVVNELITLT